MKSKQPLQEKEPHDVGLFCDVIPEQIPCRLVRSKRRTAAIYILPGGVVEVRAPLRMPAWDIAAFVRAKQHWILTHLETVRLKQELRESYHAGEGQTVYWKGVPYRVEFGNANVVSFAENRCILPEEEGQRRQCFKVYVRDEAERYLPNRLRQLSDRTGLRYRSAKVGHAATRWGSCTGRNDIRLSCYLMFLPVDCVDYVLLHELCHTVEHNHSVRFWRLMESLLPNVSELRDKLRAAERELSAQIYWINQ